MMDTFDGGARIDKIEFSDRFGAGCRLTVSSLGPLLGLRVQDLVDGTDSIIVPLDEAEAFAKLILEHVTNARLTLKSLGVRA